MSDNVTLDQNQNQVSRAMGERFRYARELSPLKRSDFCNKYDLNWYTIQSWELGRSLSRTTNVAKFIEALAAEGIFCTEAWLMEGIGPEPFLETCAKNTVYSPPITPRQMKKKSDSLAEKFIQKEINLFCDHSHELGMEAIVIHVSDNAMSPDYEVGDIIGAWKVSFDQLDSLHHSICIAEPSQNHFFVRRLLIEGDSAILMASNKDFPLIRLNNIMSIAEIVWHRRSTTQALNKMIKNQQEKNL